MLFQYAFLAVPFATAALSKPLGKRNYDYVVKETHIVPRRWERVAEAPKDHLIDLQIGLKQSRFDELERQLYEVSTPGSAKYRQHLTSEQVNELVKPSKNALAGVNEWLSDCGVKSHQMKYSAAKDWIKVTLPVSEVEKILDTEYSVYKHEDGTHVVRTPEWSVPRHLHEHVRTIQPTTSFLRLNAKKTNFVPVKIAADFQPLRSFAADPNNAGKTPTVADVCRTNGVTSECLRTLYNVYDYVPTAADKNTMGVCNYLGETGNISDTTLFLEQFRPEAAKDFVMDFTIIDGGDNQQTPNTPAQLAQGKDQEGNLDAETMLGIGYPLKLLAYNTGGQPPFQPDSNTPTNTNEPYKVFLDYFSALDDATLPSVLSNSYGDDEQTVPAEYARAVCDEYAKLGARGVSVFFASGDAGVGSTGDCITNDGRNSATFLPSFPAGCPFVTSVGATRNFAPEVAALDGSFASGAGYANYFPQPDYQKTAVNQYTTALAGQFATMFNTTGRAYPDIAAQGQRYVTIYNGQPASLDGTSASTPTVAAVFALVNDALISAGMPKMGFLNPWIYSKGFAAFNDVLTGSSAGCGGRGFEAKAGWDPVTGFGTPDFKKIIAMEMNQTAASLPAKRFTR
ncbi:tripeptidyl peptidase-like protein [Aulographum hederae CBS 113979]|uniref:tripeptidyl-peptidase II n=1 Tax=Aulographum hederae CBS 113979 TaxID=1176131 RepID=A0A6G1GU94_9PEZI|nr:tripeptidyl peptidase-like protein [Aulographum hederae CBS 113979]